ncbi:orotidine-5'-phosphate decarboxylase, partial [Ornithinicoccus halotolerans]|uniref:orotidine-5'-phosphate decarboxylase n=1 Tax=Ornithinicoccus halotolerans TaxID=1748220 RepID=UPI001297A556
MTEHPPQHNHPEDRPPSPAAFADRAVAAMERHGPLCVGVDPHPGLLREWGLSDDPAGLARFCEIAVEALAGHVAAIKPQAAFFERHGSAGVAVLEELLAELARRHTLTVLDAKRGDIGTTMAAYAEATLADGAPLAADAVTVSPYLGYGSLRPAIDLARRTGRGVFVLALTSNPEGASVQRRGEPTVAGTVASAAAADNTGARPCGPVGLVVGATGTDLPADAGVDLAALNGLLLAPGLGSQGGTPADLARRFAAAP